MADDGKDAARTDATTLVFFVNGKKVVDENVDPEWTLLYYLRRKLNLCGTKLGCAEGGCGACTVMVSRVDRSTGKIRHLAVNACLAPVCAMHGLAVTTVEGIGSTRTRLHPVQERIAKAHGSQCGFCTPGIVMSMYALLRTLPKPSMHDLEVAMQGNLCRCTGYRPILEGFRTFTEEYEELQVGSRTQGLANGGPVNGCAMGDKCCKVNGGVNGLVNGNLTNGVNGKGHGNGHLQDDVSGSVEGARVNGVPVTNSEEGCNALGAVKKTSTDDKMFSAETFVPYDPTQEPIFPPELKKSSELDKQSLRLVGPRVSWLRPTSLEDLVHLKHQHPEARIITGNTEVGVETKFKSCVYPVLISSSAVDELQAVSVEPSGLRVGAACPLSVLDEHLRLQARQQPQHRTRVLASVSSMLRWFAGNQIRNVAGLGGNIMTGSPISDLNPILMAAGCTLELRSKSAGSRQVPMDAKFFTGYRRNVVRPDEVLVSVLLPFTAEDEYMCALKQARRREDDIAIVNLALRVVLDADSHRIRDAAVAVGGMAPTTVLAPKTRAALVGSVMDNSALEDACSALAQDLPLEPGAPGGMVRYRQALALSLLMKAFLTVSAQAPFLPALPDRLQSAARPLTERPIASAQYYQSIPGTQEKTDFVGRPIVHQSAYKQATGEAVYCDDVRPVAGEVYLAPVLSTSAHARIESVDAAEALALAGVQGIVTAQDIVPGRNCFGSIAQDEEILASEKVLCHGQMIAGVLADNPLTARRAAQLVKIKYTDLPAIFTIEEAIEAKSFLTEPAVIVFGDPDGAFAAAEHVVEGEVRSAGQEHFYLETQAAFACPKGEDGEMEVVASTQAPGPMQTCLAGLLGVPKSRIVVRVKRLGGGFGGKESRAMSLAAVCAIAAHKYQRPVRAMLDRDEDMMCSGQRHPFLTRYKAAFDAQGTLLACKMDIYNNGGCSVDLSPAVMERALHHCQNSYKVPNMHLTGYCCRTNLPSNTAFRGFGAPQAMLVAETILRQVAFYLGKDVLEVMERNLLRTDDVVQYHHRLEDCNVRRCFEEVLKQADYRRRLREVQRFNRQNRYVKRGLAVLPTTYGVAYSAAFLNQAGALLQVYTDGAVLLSHGGTEMGQGLHTKMIQVASRALGIDASYIHITETATDKVPNTIATAASFSSDLNGMAVKEACEKILSRLKPFKEANPKGTWEDWVSAAFFARVSLSATGFYTTPGVNYDLKTNSGQPYAYHTYGASCSEVEVDCLTGDHKVLRTDIVMDLGESLNPAIDVGQIEGAYMQGYGMFVMEEPVVSGSGALLSRGPGAYKIPGFGDIPSEFVVTLLKGSSNPRAIYSSKAVGEPPLFLACSVLFAIREAVAAAREEEGLHGWFHLDAPATAAAVRLACEDHLTKKFPEPTPGTYKPWNIRP